VIAVQVSITIHLKICATVHANIKLGVLPHKSPSETLCVLEEVCGKVAMKKTQVYSWHKLTCDSCASFNNNSCYGRLPVLTYEKKSGVCAVLCKVTEGIVFRRYHWE
jgi:hypothetical protein